MSRMGWPGGSICALVAVQACVLAFLLSGLLAGCRPPVQAPAVARVNGAEHVAATPKHYPLHGIVLGVSLQSGEATIRHDEIHGFMPAMTMNYKVADAAALAQLKQGDEITASMQEVGDAGSYQLEAIHRIGQAAPGSLPSLPAHTLLQGEAVPNIAFEDQDGRRGNLAGFSGQTVLLTFIYTRCPLPNACPRINSNFSRIFRVVDADAQLHERVRMVSITLDPEYDSPAVLKRFGVNYQPSAAKPFEVWRFVRTTPEHLQKLASAFGLEYSASNNQITHTMRTVMIGPAGTVLKTWYGSDWNTDEVVECLRAQLAASRAKADGR